VTWAFGYFACFIVGLVLGAVTGLIRDLRSLAHHNVVLPHSDLDRPFLGLVVSRLGAGLILSGLVGLVLSVRRDADREAVLVWACAAGAAAALAATVVLRSRRCVAIRSEHATVVKEIHPGGYGQVKIERDGVAVLLAAQSVDSSSIPAGSEVEVVDCSRSVLTVRLPGRG
jgi:hypothetical protein